MKFYADAGRVRSLQIAADVAVGAWCLLWLWVGTKVYDLVIGLAVPGEYLVGASDGLDDQAGRLPSVLGPIEDGLASVARGLRGAGDAQVSAAGDLALFVAVFVVVWPVAPVLLGHLARRFIWMRAAAALSLLGRAEGLEELLAHRAVANQPMHKLARVSKDPMGDLRSGNFARLAALEAARFGLRLKKRH